MDRASSELLLPHAVFVHIPSFLSLLMVFKRVGDAGYNFSCILNNPALWQEKIHLFLLLPRDWERVFLCCAEGELPILSTFHLFGFVLLCLMDYIPTLAAEFCACVAQSDSEKNLSRFCDVILTRLCVILWMQD